MAAFKGNIEFEGSQRTQGFKPINLPDITDQIRLNAQQFESTLQRHEKATAKVREFNVKMKRDREEKETKVRMEQMAQFSEKLKAGLDLSGQMYERAKQTEAKMALLDVQTTSEDLERIRLEIASMKEDSKKIDNVKLKNAQKANYEAIAALSELDNYQKFQVHNDMVKNLGKYVKPWLNQRLATDDSTEIPIGDRVITPMQAMQGKNPAEIVAATEVLVRQFHEQTGASFLPDDLYEFSLKPQINAARSDILDKSREGWAKVQQGNARELASRTFLSDKDISKYVTSTAHLFPNGREGAWAYVHEQMKAWVENRTLNASDIREIFSQTSAVDPNKTWADDPVRGAYKDELLKIIAVEEHNDWTRSQARRQREFEQLDQNIAAQIHAQIEAGNPPNEVKLKQIQDKIFKAKFYKESPSIAAIQDGMSADDQMIARQKLTLQGLADTFILHENHPEYLKAHPDVKAAFKSLAERGTAQLGLKGSDKDHFDQLTGYVNDLTDHSPMGKAKTHIHQELLSELKTSFLNLFDANGGDARAAKEDAWKKLEERMRKPGDKFFRSFDGKVFNVKGNFDNMFTDNTHRLTVQERTSRINTALAKGGTAALAPAIYTPEELDELVKNLPKNGYKLPTIWYQLGARYGISPYKLLEDAWKHHRPGREAELKLPKAEMDLQTGYTPKELHALYGSNATPQSRAGAYCTAMGTAAWRTPDLPKNMGNHIYEAAGRHYEGTGFTQDEIAMIVVSIGDAENRGVWRDHRKSDMDAKGFMQIIPETAKRLGVDPMIPDQAADGAVRHVVNSMKFMRQNFPGLTKGEYMALSILAYNTGDGNVRANRKQYPAQGGAWPGSISPENWDYLAYTMMAMCRFGGRHYALNYPELSGMSNYGASHIEKHRPRFLEAAKFLMNNR